MIRTTRIEIWLRRREGKAQCETTSTDEWRNLAIQVQRMTNRMWQLWLCWHVEQQSESAIRSYLDQLVSWRGATGRNKIEQETARKERRDPHLEDVGQKPKLDVRACDRRLSNHIYHAISGEFTNVNARTRTLLQNKWQSLVSTRKAASGNLSGWMAILLANESLPSTTRPQPIPFDKKNSPRDTTFTVDQDGKYWMTLRLERNAGDGSSVTDRAEMVLQSRKTRSVRAIVDRVMSGEYAYKGSSLLHDRGKWFCLLSYEMPKRAPVDLDSSKEIQLIPGKKSPWIVVCPTHKWRAFGKGCHVIRFKELLQRERWSRQEHYRWAGSATKGHGQKRAKAAWTKLSSRWKHFVSRYNHEVTKRVVEIALDKRCGRIVYWQPTDKRRDQMFLVKAGKHPRSALAWEWFQVGQMLKYKADAHGIEIEIRKPGSGVPAVRKADGGTSKRRAG